MSHRQHPPDAETLLRLKRQYLVPCVYHFYRNPPVLVAGEDVWLIDSEGRRYLDCYSGVTVMSAGHARPEITKAVLEQVRCLQHTTTIYLTEPMFRLAERLAGIAPGGLRRSFFCASGSEANEAALLMAVLATGRQGVVALRGGLHGRTKWAMSVTGLDLWRTDPHPLETVHFAPNAYCARCPLGKTHPDCALACVDALESVLVEAGPHNIAALIAEPIQGNGGIVTPPPGYWQRVRELCTRHGILLIFDEIQTGINRTGRWFASEHWGVAPDIMTVAKALGNGMPIAAAITTDDIAGAYTRPGAATFGANPVSCASALATLEVHEKLGLGARADAVGGRLFQGLLQLQSDSAHLAHARGMGLMLGIEVVEADGAPSPARCDHCLERLKDLGFLAGKTGPHRNTLTFMPPLTVPEAEIDRMLEALATAIHSTTEMDTMQ